jgi:hypothetical protein
MATMEMTSLVVSYSSSSMTVASPPFPSPSGLGVVLASGLPVGPPMGGLGVNGGPISGLSGKNPPIASSGLRLSSSSPPKSG